MSPEWIVYIEKFPWKESMTTDSQTGAAQIRPVVGSILAILSPNPSPLPRGQLIQLLCDNLALEHLLETKE